MNPFRFLLPMMAAGAMAGVLPASEAPHYVGATATHILPETTSEESGYFSLHEAHDGTIGIGTAKYGHNAYLVEFDPRSGHQRIALDTHRTCGLSATGYAAQAKLHTRNSVGSSGRVYVGSKQGYPKDGDQQKYPGGYAMVYDARTGKAENLGMPFPGEGVIDVMADESRDRLFVVTCEEQHWMLGSAARGGPWKELGPKLTPYASTLIDSQGTACAITADFQLARCDRDGSVGIRPILINGKPWQRANLNSIPTWVLDRDGSHAWTILMNDPTLLRIDLGSGMAEECGRMTSGRNPDSRCALTQHPDGRIYAIVRTDNETSFGGGYLHHLLRYDPDAKRHEDLGVLKVSNPGYFDWSPAADGKPKPWTHGFHRLPDGTLTPMHAHMALIATRDGTLYATVIYPFTLLKIDAFRLPVASPSPEARYLDSLLGILDQSAERIAEITRLAEALAERHEKGGLIGFPWIGTTLEQELMGRAGGLMHIGFERPWKKERTPEEQALDAVIYAWDDAPGEDAIQRLEKDRGIGRLVVGFGPRKSRASGEVAARCHHWIDTGAGDDDRTVTLPSGRRTGKTNHFANAVNGWLLIAEFTAALTRRGHMPVMWKAWITEDGKAWSDRYFGKQQFHTEFKVPPVAAGQLAGAYLERIRYLVRRLRGRELDSIVQFAAAIAAETKAGRRTVVASSGHMAMSWIGRWDDKAWGLNHEVHDNVAAQTESFQKDQPDGALVLRLDAYGLHRDVDALFRKKNQRVLLVTAENPRPEYAVPADRSQRIDMGYAHGDACVSIPGYPIPILPPSGVLQVAAYESINVGAVARLAEPP